MSIVGSEFRPSWWLCNPHVQTVLASRLVRPPPPPVSHERLELDDGDFIDLAHTLSSGPPLAPGSITPSAPPSATTADPGEVHGAPHAGRETLAADDGPRVLLLHGLAGSLDSAYARGAMRSLVARGFGVTLMHWRGCSGEPNRLARSYHSGESGDVARLVALLRERHPRSPLYALGFSLGGNALLKYLGERGEDTPLAAALAVCPPLVLEVGATQLDRGIARGYRNHLLGLMRAQHEAKRARHPELDLPPAHAGLDSFWRFDDELTAPLHGFDGVEDYYARCGARRFLGGIRRPTHILVARDDPFFTEAILPERHELAPGTLLELAEHGGHVGFLAGGRGWPPRRWLDERVADVLAGLHDVETRRRSGPGNDAIPSRTHLHIE